MIKVTLKDNTVKEFPEGITAYEAAKEISMGLSPVLSNLTPMHCCAGWTSSSWPHRR